MSDPHISRSLIHSVWRTAKGIPATVWTLGVVSLLTDVSTEMAIVILPLFLTVTLGASVAFVGLLEGIADTTASLLKVFSGWLSDRLGKRKAITVAGYSVSCATRPLLALAASADQVLGARFLDRVGKGLRTSPRDALLAASVPPNRRGFVVGVHRSMDLAGAIIGPLTTFVLLANFPGDYRRVFWIAVIPAIITIPLLVWGVRETPPAEQDTQVPLTGGMPGAVFRRYLIVVFGFTLANSSDAFLILRAKGLGIADAHIPLLFAALHVSKMLSSVPGGALSDKLGRKTLIITGWLIYAAVYFGFALAQTPGHIWALFLVYGLFFGMTEGTERAWVADLVAADARGRAYGWFHFAVGIGALPASLLMGLIWAKLGVVTAFCFGAGMALLAAIALSVFVGEQRPDPL